MSAFTIDKQVDRTFTAKGRATRERIVEATSALMLEHGPAGAKLEDIQSSAGVSASQIYHYFDSKGALMLAVIDYRTDAVLGTHREALERVDSFDTLEQWRNAIVAAAESQNCVGGCPLGSLATATAETDPSARVALEKSFSDWGDLLCMALESMRDRGELRTDIDVESLAVSMLASIQGGQILSQTRRDSAPLRIALDMSIAYLKTLQ